MGMESLIFGGLSAIGGMMSSGAANRAAKQNTLSAIMELQGQYQQVNTQNEQLLQEVDLIRMNAEGQFNERYQQLQDVKENNRLFVATSGLSTNQSEQVASEVSDRKAYNDIGAIEFSAAAQRRNISQQIKVNRDSLKFAGFKAAGSIQNSVHHAQGVAQQAMLSTVSSLFKYAPPGTFGAGSGMKTYP